MEGPVSGGVAGREALVDWIRAAYPGLDVDEKDPLNFDSVSLCRCRRDGKVIERFEMVKASIMDIAEDGMITWEYRKLRVRPWWRALYRWWMSMVGKPVPGPPGGKHEEKRDGPRIQAS